MGSACAYLFDKLSHAAFADEQSRPAWTFGRMFMSIVDRACASPSSHLTNLSASEPVGLGMVPEMYGHSLAPLRYGVILVFQNVQFEPSSFSRSDSLNRKILKLSDIFMICSWMVKGFKVQFRGSRFVWGLSVWFSFRCDRGP